MTYDLLQDLQGLAPADHRSFPFNLSLLLSVFQSLLKYAMLPPITVHLHKRFLLSAMLSPPFFIYLMPINPVP